jgi:hypothetical protein
MNEMTKKMVTIHQGGSVKKTLLVVALAAILVFVFTGSAFAEFNRSGQQRLGARVPIGSVDASGLPTTGGESAVVANGPYAGQTVRGAGTLTYLDWTPSLGTNSADSSPHGNYTTTTVKCVVCHAVHYAAPGNAPASSGLQDADTLLRMKASQACAFCHATAGMAVNGTPVYDGLNPTPGQTGGNTNGGHATGTNCDMCHTSVHGVGQDNSVASLAGFLLKKQPLAAGPNGAPVNQMIDAIQQIDDLAISQGFDAGAALGADPFTFNTDSSPVLRERGVGIFCAECHNGAYSTVAAGATTNVKGSDTVAYSGHRIMADANTNWNAGGTVSSSTFSGTVAWAPATGCTSCHDSNDIYGNTAFPHSWGNTKMWLTSAANVGAPKENLPFGTAPGSAYNTGRPQLSDGVCLKCHVSSTGEGVGLTF